MKKLLLLTPLVLAGCTVNPAQVAADAAFCSSAESILQNLSEAYENQVVDSEFVLSATDFLSSITEPLSEELEQDIDNLSAQLSSSAPVSETSEAIDRLVADINLRCQQVGVEF
ncbi:MAG: hypothetical protein RI590_04250 [Microbacteriaceae bacterium]|nr:hypothetical protein [Microbacteriaceae bacterium]MDR9444147.1 hypothetical protein [Microbacteriaceae bacterium]